MPAGSVDARAPHTRAPDADPGSPLPAALPGLGMLCALISSCVRAPHPVPGQAAGRCPRVLQVPQPQRSPQHPDLTFSVPGPEEPRPQHQAPVRLGGPQDEPGGRRASHPQLLPVSDPGARAPGGWPSAQACSSRATAGRLGRSAVTRRQVRQHLRAGLVGLHRALLGEEGTGGRRPGSSAQGPAQAPLCSCPQPLSSLRLVPGQLGESADVRSGGRSSVAGSGALVLPHGSQGALSPCCHSHPRLLWARDLRWLLLCRRPPGGSSRPRSAALSPC